MQPLTRAAVALNALSDAVSVRKFLTTDEMKQAKAAATEQTILQATEQLAVDWNGGGMEAYLATYWNSDQLSLMFGDQAIRGWENVAKLFRGTWTTEENMGDFSTRDVVVRQISPDTAPQATLMINTGFS